MPAPKEKKPALKRSKKQLESAIANHIDPYTEELEKKFDIEGSTVQEVVFLRQSNDLIESKHLFRLSTCAKSLTWAEKYREKEEANAALEKELAALKVLVATHERPEGESNADEQNGLLGERLQAAGTDTYCSVL